MKPKMHYKQIYDSEIFEIDCSERIPNTVTISSVDAKVFTEDGYDISTTWTLSNKTDISFFASTKKIVSGASEFSITALFVGREFTVSGSVSNNETYTVAACTTSELTVNETLIDEVAGATVTINALGMVNGTPSKSGNYVYVQVQNGVDGEKYNVRVRLTLSNGEYAEDDIILFIQERPRW